MLCEYKIIINVCLLYSLMKNSFILNTSSLSVTTEQTPLADEGREKRQRTQEAKNEAFKLNTSS